MKLESNYIIYLNWFNLKSYKHLNLIRKLENFVANKREKENEKSNFYVTYLISGEEKSTKVIEKSFAIKIWLIFNFYSLKTNKIQLVNENDFDKFNKETKVFSKQIYSIQNNIIEVKIKFLL